MLIELQTHCQLYKKNLLIHCVKIINLFFETCFHDYNEFSFKKQHL
jgi:hypothetical protein